MGYGAIGPAAADEGGEFGDRAPRIGIEKGRPEGTPLFRSSMGLLSGGT